MKKLLTLTALLGAASLSFGQGYVGFTTGTTSRISTNNATATGFAGSYDGAFTSTVPGPGQSWYYELLVAPTTQNTIDATLSGWTPIFTGSNQASAGREAGTSPGANTGGIAVPGTSSTDTRNFAVVGWSANLGSDYTAVFNGRPSNLVSGAGNIGSGASLSQLNAPDAPGYTGGNAQLQASMGGPGAFYGISGIASAIPLAAVAGPYASVWGTSAIPSMSMNYYTVPEPATFALAGLGAAALLILRRRK